MVRLLLPVSHLNPPPKMASRRRGVILCISFLLLVGASSFRYEEAMGGSILLSGGWEREDDEPFEYPRDGLSCPSPDLSLYNLPVIGIVSHPGDGASGRLSNASGDSNIPASYVKFVESAGARVIPLIYNEPEETLIEKLNLVNGVLFTGGWAKTGLYYETIKKVFQIALERNDAGEHFPLFAICLGFELLTMIISKDRDILERFHGENQASSLYFQDYSDVQRSVFERYFIDHVLTYQLYYLRSGKICETTSRFPNELLRKLSTECLAMQNHKFGISPKKFQGNAALSSFSQILTTSKDENGKVYVSTVQAYNYPVTGFQWHPEKNAFEWGLSMIPHSEDAVRVTQHVANYFISEARKSSNRPPADKVLDNLIYNYSPTYCGRAGRGYDEVYIFNFPHSSM